jgi:phosphoglucomutase
MATVKRISTTPFSNQRSGTSGLCKRVSTQQGLRILLADGSRFVCRLSGTGTSGATLRLYLERYRSDGGKAVLDDVLAPLAQEALQLLELRQRCGREAPTVIT